MRKRAARRRARVTVRELIDAADPAFRPAHALLRSSFHRGEMLPVADWRNAMRERRENLWTDLNWHLLVAERNGKVLAAASGSYQGNLNIGLVGYIAVAPAARAMGLGPRMRRALVRRFEADAWRLHGAPLRAIVGEVRPDNPWLGTLVRQGAIALDFPYYQPSLGKKKEPVPLVLYYQPMDRPRRSLPVAEVRRMLFSIWRRSYRVPRPLQHPEFRAMLRTLRGKRVGSRPDLR
ncbi:MAG TPA: GNAT family N-acetyltransferase [Gemmatimonadaceae bacterium]|nr:GNAT family N-acetyltransferase [Gemmatimonadaceae bacterium]